MRLCKGTRLVNVQAAPELSRAQGAGKFLQRQRVAARFDDQLIDDPFVDHPGCYRLQQLARLIVVQTLDEELRQVRELLIDHPHRQDKRDAFVPQASSNGSDRPGLIQHRATERHQ